MDRAPRRSRTTPLLSVIAGVALVVPLIALAPTSVKAAPSQFGPYRITAVGSEPEAVAIGDVTGDGINDVVLTTGYDNTALDFHLLVFAGAADGTLADPVSYPTAGTYPDRPETVAIGDVTADGRRDVVVGLSGLGVQLFPQAADGTLGAPTLVESADSHKIAIGVFDQTDRPRVAGIGWGTNTVTIFGDDGDGLRASATYAARHGGYDDLETGDVTGDGLTDIVVMSGQLYATPNVSVLAQRFDGTFAPAAEYGVGGNVLTSGIGVSDVTGDGLHDVLASYGGNSPNGRLGIFQQAADGTLEAPPIPYQSYDLPGAVEVVDVDRDGNNDAIVVHDGWLRVGVYPGIDGGLFSGEDLYPVPFSNGGNPHGLAVGDVTADGWPDIVVADDLNGLLVLPNVGSDVPDPTPTPSFTYPPPTPTPSPTPSPTPTLTPVPVPPSAPRSLAASPNLAAGVGLTWEAPVSQGTSAVTGYRIYRATGSGSYASLVQVGNVLAYTDASVSNGTTYRYQVAAMSAAGVGAKSAEVVAARGTAPAAPANLTATVSKSGIVLKWAAPASNGGSPVTGYRVYRGTTSANLAFYVSYGPDAIGMTDTSVTRRTRYYYRVTALSVLGEGASTPTVNATAR
jgi:hypothetical protein